MDDILVIDLNRLEEVCINHPRLMREWADKLAEAKRVQATSANKVKLVKAEMGMKVRQRPSAYGIEKVNNDVVDEAVMVSKEYQAALAAAVEADYDVDILKGMTDALNDRGKQLTNACSLHGQQYWSKPRADPETREGITGKTRDDVMAKVAAATTKARNERSK